MLINAIRGGETHWNEAGPFVIGGESCQMETAHLSKVEMASENENEIISAVEYWDGVELVHRSVNIQLKTPLNIFGEQGKIS